MLVDQHGQEEDTGSDAPGVGEADGRIGPAGRNQKPGHQRELRHMDRPGDSHGTLAAETLRDGVQALCPVDLFIGQRIKDIEAAGPEEDHQRQQDDWQRQTARHGDESARRGDAQRRSHPEVAKLGETFQVAVAQQENQCNE